MSEGSKDTDKPTSNDSFDATVARNSLNSLAQKISALGMTADIIALHQRRVLESVHNPIRTFPIATTCNLANGGILSFSQISAAGKGSVQASELTPTDYPGMVALVPSAGAASRYVAPLEKLSIAMASGSETTITDALHSLKDAGAQNWALPRLLLDLLSSPTKIASLSEAQRLEISQLADTAKALFPCTKQGTSFLEMKVREHDAIGGLLAQVFVAPARMANQFSAALKIESSTSTTPISFEEQGELLSTVRFNKDGTPFVDTAGNIAPVPAGHGALTRLFDRIRATIFGATSLFIRNIDNVCGTQREPIEATRAFLSIHASLLESIVRIRAALLSNDFTKAAAAAGPFEKILKPDLKNSQLSSTHADSISRLWKIQSEIFHTNRSDVPDSLSDEQALKWSFSRPFNLLGQVANTGKDVGGTPVFVDQTRLRKVGANEILQRTRKICIEVPHASAEDAEKFLRNPVLATHFNPVFIAAEIPADPDWYDGSFDPSKQSSPIGGKKVETEECAGSSHPFWLVASKSFRNQAVFYHESLLSEVLGNSYMTNFAFVEIPRSLFNPHKTLADAADRSDSDWA